MKSKRKIDKKAIQQFFLDHTEKIVIGLVGLLFLYFTYSAVMLQVNDSYKQTPETLKQAITTAQGTMNSGISLGKIDLLFPVQPYAEKIDEFKRPLDPKPWVWNQPPYVNVVPPNKLRETPSVVAIKDLRATPGRCAFSGTDSAVGTVGQRWVVVTGLAPYHEQTAKYHDAFAGTVDESGMEPSYVGFLVQRGEVVPGSAAPKWEKAMTVCTAPTFATQMGRWNGIGSEVVDPKVIEPAVTSPLPARTVGEWGEEVAHPKEIKLLPRDQQTQAPGGVQFGAGARFPQGGYGAVGRIGMQGFTGRQPTPGANDPGMSYILGGSAPRADAAKPKPEDAVQTPDYLLMRYFDFDVEPGKQYAYRVFPLLSNPNYKLPDGVLDKAEESQKPLLAVAVGSDRPSAASIKVADWKPTDAGGWSAPCQSAKLPGDMRLFAGPTEPPKSAPNPVESNSTVRILRWDEKSGLNSSCEVSGQLRGANLDFSDINVVVRGQAERERVPRLNTDSVLVDLNEVSVHDRIHPPGMMLVLDGAGNLVIHEEATEAKEWNAETKEPEQSNPAGNRGPNMERPPPRLVPGRNVLPDNFPGAGDRWAHVGASRWSSGFSRFLFRNRRLKAELQRREQCPNTPFRSPATG